MSQKQEDVLDISGSPELLQLAEQVRSSGKAYVIAEQWKGSCGDYATFGAWSAKALAPKP